jgi:hypothetical protein
MAWSKAAKSLERVVSLTLDMEEPLNEAMRFTLALRLMGQGIVLQGGEEGRAVAEVASAVSDRLDKLKATWDRTYKIARG